MGNAETALMNEISVALSKAFRALVIRVNCGEWPGPGGGWIKGAATGTSDLVVCVPPGLFVAVEVKRPGERQTADQKRFEKSVHMRGGTYVLARSVDEAIAGVERVIQGLQR